MTAFSLIYVILFVFFLDVLTYLYPVCLDKVLKYKTKRLNSTLFWLVFKNDQLLSISTNMKLYYHVRLFSHIAQAF